MRCEVFNVPHSKYPRGSRQDSGRAGAAGGGGVSPLCPAHRQPPQPGGRVPAEQLPGGLRLRQHATPGKEEEEEEEEEVRASVGVSVQLSLCGADGSVPLVC